MEMASRLRLVAEGGGARVGNFMGAGEQRPIVESQHVGLGSTLQGGAQATQTLAGGRLSLGQGVEGPALGNLVGRGIVLAGGCLQVDGLLKYRRPRRLL